MRGLGGAVEEIGDPGLDLSADEPPMLAELEAREQPTAGVVLDRALPEPEQLGNLAGGEDVLAPERAVAPRIARMRPVPLGVDREDERVGADAALLAVLVPAGIPLEAPPRRASPSTRVDARLLAT
jgi:hypothetical protein